MDKVTPIKTYLLVWIALLLLLALTSVTAYFKLGVGNTLINFGISIAKTILIVVFFMHLFKGDAAKRLTVALAMFMLGLLALLSFSDYLARESHPAPWRAPQATLS